MNTNEPVLVHGTGATIAGALVPVLIEAGVQANTAGRVGSFVGAAAMLALALVGLFAARGKVTPLQPMTGSGVTLVEQIADKAVNAAIVKLTPGAVLTLSPGATISGSSVTGGVVEQPQDVGTPDVVPAADTVAGEPGT